MSKRERPLTQLENFAPTTKRSHTANSQQVEASLPKYPAALLSIHTAGRPRVEAQVGSFVPQQTGGSRNESSTVDLAKQRAEHRIGTTSQRPYHNLMPLDQAGASVIAHDDADPPT
jgi:hypothetical protein